MRLVAGALALAALTGCNSDRSGGLPPPGEAVAASDASASGSASGGGGSDPSGTAGSGGQPPLPTPEDCGCLAEAGDEVCRACIDEAGLACVDPLTECDGLGEGYCGLVFDCIALCPTPDAYCIDTCLGAHDSARTTVEAYVACACAGCAEACGEGACD